MKHCPKCGCEEFYVTAHVVQDWLVDKYGDYIDTTCDCIEVAHYPEDDDIWCCKQCGYEAEGNEFNIKEKE